MRFSNEQLEDIRQKADIVDVIGRYLNIIQSGKNYKCVCPFHDDHDPSMSISVEKQIYHCFSCKAGGNVFNFVQNYEKIPFTEAVLKVASLVHYDLPLQQYQLKPKDPIKENYYRLLNEAISYLKYNLYTESHQSIKNYLLKRGVTDKILETLQIGYNDKNNALYHYLIAKNKKVSDLIDVNLIKDSEQGLIDVFSDRIMFPIHDENGNPVGFSARTMHDYGPKYINTSSTPIYQKGNIIYHFYQAKHAIKQARRVYLVEGVFDVIAFLSIGIENVVSTLGTACSRYQIRLLKKVCSHVVLCYDGDDAGQNATFHLAKDLLAENLQVSIVRNDLLKDPDEIRMEHGNEALRALLTKEYAWVEFCLQYYLKKYDLNLYDEKKVFIQSIIEEAQLLKDDYDKQMLLEQLFKLTGYRYKQRPKEQPKKILKTHNKSALNGNIVAEYYVVAYMLDSPRAVSIYLSELGFLVDKACYKLANLIVTETGKNNPINIASLMNATEDEAVHRLLTELVSNSLYCVEFDEEKFYGYINKIKFGLLEYKNKELIAQIKIEQDTLKKKELMLKYQENLEIMRRYRYGKK